jgi:hypothetical protein
MRPYLNFILSIAIVISFEGCGANKQNTENQVVKSPNVEINSKPKQPISACKYLDNAIIRYAGPKGPGISINPEENKTALNIIFTKNPDFPKNRSQALKRMKFYNSHNQLGAYSCKWNEGLGYWQIIRVAKDHEIIAIYFAELKLKTKTTPLSENNVPQIMGATIFQTDAKNRYLYNKLNTIFATN